MNVWEHYDTDGNFAIFLFVVMVVSSLFVIILVLKVMDSLKEKSSMHF